MHKTNLFKRTLSCVLATALGLLALGSVSFAQVPSSAAIPFQPSTFVAAFSVAVPQTGAGDIACINGSASRLIKVKKITISGIKTTAQTALFNLVKRSAADTGGTPITAPTLVPLDTTQVLTAATATVAAWTVIPTPGAAVGNIGARYLGFSVGTVASIANATYTWDVTNNYSDTRLRGVAQGLCLNAPAAFTTDGPTLQIEITWTEQ